MSLPVATRLPAVMLPPVVQAAVLLALIAGAAALAVLGCGRIGANRLIAEKAAAVLRVRAANADLQGSITGLKGNIAGLQGKLAAAGRDRRQAAERLDTAADEAATLRGLLADAAAKLHTLEAAAAVPAGNDAKEPPPAPPPAAQTAAQTAAQSAAPTADGRAAQLAKALDQTRLALHQAAAEGATLSARLSKTEADRAQQQTQYEETTRELQSVIGELERELLRRSAGSRKLASASPAVLDTEGVAGVGRQGVGGVARVLASAGVDVARLFSRFGIERGEGGPFVPPRKAGAPAPSITPQQLAALRGMMQSLPLGTPVAHYQIGSPFGARTDPFNGRAAIHTGIDFDAPYMSAVYATAPGTVVFAGYRGEYGKVVEIDHGDGIHTLYAHLHRVAVAVGEKVAAHGQIGWLGTTGRSSGPHVHYEVLVNGEPLDPEKFIGLARLVPAAAR